MPSGIKRQRRKMRPATATGPTTGRAADIVQVIEGERSAERPLLLRSKGVAMRFDSLKALAMALTLASAPCHAEKQQVSAGNSPAAQEFGSELSDEEQAEFNALRSSMGMPARAALFDLLDQLPTGARGAFVGDLLAAPPPSRTNIVNFLALLTPAQRSGIAG